MKETERRGVPSDVGRQRTNEQEYEKAKDLGRYVSLSLPLPLYNLLDSHVIVPIMIKWQKKRIILTRRGLFDL